MDEPMITQPLMYKRIKSHPSVLTIYSDKLIKEGVITETFANQVCYRDANSLQTEVSLIWLDCGTNNLHCAQEIDKYLDYCEEEYKKAQTISTMQMSDWHDVPWTDFFSNQSPRNKIPPTGIDMSVIKTICNAISTPSRDIEAHAQVSRRACKYIIVIREVR